MTIVGAVLGGVLTMRFGVMRVLFTDAVLSAGTNTSPLHPAVAV